MIINRDCKEFNKWLVPANFYFFFFNDTATTEIYTLSLHDALPIFSASPARPAELRLRCRGSTSPRAARPRSEEHTSELQSPCNLVCRLLLEKKKKSCVEALEYRCEDVFG